MLAQVHISVHGEDGIHTAICFKEAASVDQSLIRTVEWLTGGMLSVGLLEAGTCAWTAKPACNRTMVRGLYTLGFFDGRIWFRSGRAYPPAVQIISCTSCSPQCCHWTTCDAKMGSHARYGAPSQSAQFGLDMLIVDEPQETSADLSNALTACLKVSKTCTNDSDDHALLKLV